ncbi:acyl-coenzyme A synthetase/AMP-(fatty) acid ligase [Agromyces flavus]|uniref:Acyl-CoA synthetase (AMP-forming)/AMP-acid ligase II n=1 Tax=Agromyces flavus TaxID=589382 RepID=A0A1H1UV03_9MICO|nr:AMP-binding protein [Agromyces flavus]MCP2368146.1 acyl-coenzyme A synthetase/AMP-(fatty) acid ligase [Agromyces flavus]GGI47606.1 AMP-dependent synthetase [Agromyces flavus]SDS75709.1 Acyl-CoA synthetase (AMP-forming)/AMP-acid ligase II [Agromyces flavus]
MRTTLTRTEPAVLDLLGGDSSAAAIVTGDVTVDYGELAERVADRRAALGTGRRLVFLTGSNTVETVVTYLAALAGGHPVLLQAGGADGAPGLDGLIDRYRPDVIVTAGPDGADAEVDDRGAGSRHAFHPELALLASTSGSTGSPKLVRLSRANVLSNARSIADYLRLTPDDRAATTLPLHYCYGLSVVNSHLISGGSLLLTDRSVVEPEFWSEFDAAGATSFAGVPYTYDLLDSTDFAQRRLPSLRYVTQAGGRLAPERVRSLALLGRERGFEIVVMYGQTEATARMAYLPPSLAESAAGAIGVPIPGGSFRIDESVGGGAPGEGELVYSGPNVMMGYAEESSDFIHGPEHDELRTGDLARQRDDGLYEITGRLSRFVKGYGLRLDLDRIERLLATDGIEARSVGVDERLAVFVRHERFAAAAREAVQRHSGLPTHAFDVHALAEFPRTANGKPDHAALRAHAAMLQATVMAATATDASGSASTASADSASDLRDLYAELLARPDATEDDSFTTLDGDSLNYVELALRLEERIGALPADWPSRRIRELAPRAAPRSEADPATVPADEARTVHDLDQPKPRRRIARLETSVVLRAAAILLIVATHADVVQLKGGAHLLLAVAGFNLARFRLSGAAVRGGEEREARTRRVRGLLRSVRALAVPAVLWIGGVALIAGTYDPATVLLSNWAVPGATGWSEQWQFWFLEALIWSFVGLAVLFAVPRVGALERRYPYAFALVVLGAVLAWRYVVAGGVTPDSPMRYALPAVAWLIALGWLVARSTTLLRRVAATAIVLATVAGFFGDPVRESIVLVGLGLLVWVTSLPVPAFAAGAVGTVASASMFVYLTHWQVYPPIEEVSPPLAIAASFAVGLAAWWAWGRLGAATRRLSARRRRG